MAQEKERDDRRDDGQDRAGGGDAAELARLQDRVGVVVRVEAWCGS